MAQASYQYSGTRPGAAQTRIPGVSPPRKPKGGVMGSGLNQRQWERTWQKAAGVTPPPKATPSPAPTPSPGTPAVAAKTSPDPRDATYWAQRAKLLSQDTQNLAGAEQQQSYEDTDFHEALRRRALQGQKDIQGIREGANREGLAFSGQLGKRQGDYEVGAAQQEGDARQVYERAKAERAPVITALREALRSGLPVDEAALYAEAVDRQTDRDAANPPSGVDTDAVARLMAALGQKPQSAAAAPGKRKRKGVQGSGLTQRQWENAWRQAAGIG